VGDPAEVIAEVASEVGATRVAANADVSAFSRQRDRAVADRVPLELHWSNHVHGPEAVLKSDGTPYQVFTPYHRAWEALPLLVDEIPTPEFGSDAGSGLPTLGSVPPTDSAAAWRRVERWLGDGAARYESERDRVDRPSTSGLSVDLKFGTLSPAALAAELGRSDPGPAALVRQVAWRDFWAQQMWHGLGSDPGMRRWRADAGGLEAWQRGSTGIPIVDAAMRQLVAEGLIHGRVRMLAASFLVKHLLVDWRLGESFFRRHLRDGDPAQNVGNWRWVAGIGPGSAPWFRVMNPVLQARRHDPHGEYVRRWVPELAAIEGADVHAPWELPEEVRSGLDYPEPVVDLAFGRERALAAG
jgi:deoxyribodipyrimidine photo-lyase